MYANDTRPRELYKTRAYAKLKPREECVCAGVWPTTGNYRATVFLISDTNEIPYRPLIRGHPLVLVINNLSGAQTCGRVNLMELITGRSYIRENSSKFCRDNFTETKTTTWLLNIFSVLDFVLKFLSRSFETIDSMKF